jgi:hypothetical protein
MKNAFLNNNDMSQYDKDIIDQALAFLKEDNKRFVKIVTAKKNVVAALSDIKIISDNKFYPVQYWLDTVTDPKHIEVLKELSYESDRYLDWWGLKFGSYIARNSELSEIFNRPEYRLGGKSINNFSKELVEKIDSEPFYDREQHDAVDQWMSVLLDKIYRIIKPSAPSPSAETPVGTTTTETGDPAIPQVSPESAPLVADVTKMEPEPEVDGFIKGRETLINVCTKKMQSLKPSDKIIFYGSETFNFISWWTSLPNRYKGTDIVKILGKPVRLYAESLDPEKQGAYVPAEINKTKITNPATDPRLKSGTAPAATTTEPAAPISEISASFLISKFIKIAAEAPERTFDELFDDVLDDYLESAFGDPPTDDGEVKTVDDKKEDKVVAPETKKPNIFEILKKSLQRKPEEYVAIQSSGLDPEGTMKLYEFPFESRLKDNLFYDPEQQDVIVDGKKFINLINQLLNAILTFENQKKKQQVDNANNIAEQLKNTMDFTSSIYEGLGKSNLPNYKPRTRGKL